MSDPFPFISYMRFSDLKAAGVVRTWQQLRRMLRITASPLASCCRRTPALGVSTRSRLGSKIGRSTAKRSIRRSAARERERERSDIVRSAGETQHLQVLITEKD